MANKNTDKAGTKELDALHRLVADTLVDEIKSGENPMAAINAAIKFLKDNGIQAAVASEGSPLANLAATLPFAGADEDMDGAYTQ